jgi:hypothetical protein
MSVVAHICLVGFQEDIQQFIPQGEICLKLKGLVTLLTIIHSDNVQHSVKHKLDFDELKSVSKKTILEIKFLCDFSIVTFDIRIFYICEKSLYQNFDLNSLYYIIIFIVFISQRKGKFSYINFTSNAQHNFKCNIFVCKAIFQCKYFFNANNFFNEIKVSMKNVFQCK